MHRAAPPRAVPGEGRRTVTAAPQQSAGLSLREFALRALVLVAIAAAAVLLWHVRFALLLGFAAIVVAALLLAAADPFRRWAKLPHKTSVIAGGTLIVLVLGSFGVLVWPRIRDQAAQLLQQLPTSIQELERHLGQLPGPLSKMAPSTLVADLAQYFTSWTTMLLGIVGSVALVLITGAFLAAAPDRYRDGMIALIPAGMAGAAGRGFEAVGRSLRRWLMAQFLSMLIVGVVTALGTWAIGLPAPLALGLVAALFEFVPIVGPVVAAVPALLVAMADGLHVVLWTLLLYLSVQQVESNVIMPLIEQEMVSIPPAVLLVAIAACGALFGISGVLLGAPLTVMLYAFVREVYVRPRGSPAANGKGSQ